MFLSFWQNDSKFALNYASWWPEEPCKLFLEEQFNASSATFIPWICTVESLSIDIKIIMRFKRRSMWKGNSSWENGEIYLLSLQICTVPDCKITIFYVDRIICLLHCQVLVNISVLLKIKCISSLREMAV